jgi:hypothetical protein
MILTSPPKGDGKEEAPVAEAAVAAGAASGD